MESLSIESFQRDASSNNVRPPISPSWKGNFFLIWFFLPLPMSHVVLTNNSCILRTLTRWVFAWCGFFFLKQQNPSKATSWKKKDNRDGNFFDSKNRSRTDLKKKKREMKRKVLTSSNHLAKRFSFSNINWFLRV